MAIVTLTRHGDDAYLQELLRAGVSGYVLKQSAPAELLQAIRAAAAGGQYLDSTLTARVTAGFLGREGRRVGKSGATLSERESEVLRLIASGYSNKEIAARLDLSVKTVEAHKANAMRKLGLTGRIDIVKSSGGRRMCCSGSPGDTGIVLEMLGLGMERREPISTWRPGQPLDLPSPNRVITLIFHDVDKLTPSINLSCSIGSIAPLTD